MNTEKKNQKFKADSLIEILETKGIKGFLNSTGRNDLTESIHNEELELQIFLPNSENDNWENEEWNKFRIPENFVFNKPSSNIVNIIKNMGYEFE